MNKERKYYLFLFLTIVLYVVVQSIKPKPIDWSPFYTKNSSIPYGTQILYSNLSAVFSEDSLESYDESIFLRDRNLFVESDSTYEEESEFEENLELNEIYINSSFSFDPLETEILLNRSASGAQIFIAGNLDGLLADTLNIKYDFVFSILDSLTGDDEMVEFKLANPNLEQIKPIEIRNTEFYSHFSSFDSSNTTILGFMNDSLPNFIRIGFGEGNFYLHSNPKLFTNYYLRDPDFAPYSFASLSYLPNQKTYWDDFYKNGRAGAGTPLYVILNEDSLRKAWYLTLFAIFMFMIFKSKRVQRIIPILNPPENSSIKFAETIGQLYLEKGNHKKILDKKILFFFEYINSHFGISSEEITEREIENLSLKSGIELNEIESLIDLIHLVKDKEKVTEKELKMVTDQIDQFYKQSEK